MTEYCDSFKIFWDIENCPIPRRLKANDVVMAVRKFIKDNYGMSNVCGIICYSQDEALSNSQVDQLNNCEVDVLRVSKTTANNLNADKKLMKFMDEYINHHLDKDIEVY